MISLPIALVIFAGLSFAQAEIGPNIAELKKTVLANKLVLEKAITEYETLGFHSLSELVKFQFYTFSKNQIRDFMKIPTNLTVNDLSDNQYRTYRMMIMDSKLMSVYSNAAQITDLLKTDALYSAGRSVDDLGDIDESHPLILTEIVDRVLKVIHEEEGVLVNGRFVKPNSELNYLYGELKEIKLESFFYRQMKAEELNEECALPSTGCGKKLRGVIHNGMVLKEKAESCSPIDSELKVYKLLAILYASRRAHEGMLDALEAANFGCLVILQKDACKKRFVNYNPNNPNPYLVRCLHNGIWKTSLICQVTT